MDTTSLSIVASSEAGLVHEVEIASAPAVMEDQARLTQWLAGMAAEHDRAEVLESEFRIGESTDPAVFSLHARQLAAFRAVVQGESITAAARQAGVGRRTVHRWMKEDPAFKAALARHAQEQESVAREHLRGSVEAAARNVHHAVKQGHLSASMNVLRNAGLMGTRPAEQPRPARAVDQRVAVALEQRLGQLLSMLAQHPATAGQCGDVEPDAPAPTPDQIDRCGDGAPSDPEGQAMRFAQQDCATEEDGRNSSEIKQ